MMFVRIVSLDFAHPLSIGVAIYDKKNVTLLTKQTNIL